MKILNRMHMYALIVTLTFILAPLTTTSMAAMVQSEMMQSKNILTDVPHPSDVLKLLDAEGMSTDDKNPLSNDREMQFDGFIENRGQLSDDSIMYYFSARGISVGFCYSKINFHSIGTDGESVFFSLTFPGSNEIAPLGVKQKVHVVNYIMSDRQISNIPTFDEMLYSNLYEGIDLRYYMSFEGLKYEFIVHPGADPSRISIAVSDPISLHINDQQVSYYLDGAPIFQDTGIVVFQEDGTEISTCFSTMDNPDLYGFEVASFDHDQTLVIDPWFLPLSTHLIWGYFGDYLYGLAVDADGNSYVTGYRWVDEWPENRNDLYIGKHASNGTPIYSSYYVLGSDDQGLGMDIEIDSLGKAYVCGYTDSYSFPTSVDANDTTYNGGDFDAFMVIMNSTGGMEYSTYLGGSGSDTARAIDFDPISKEIYVAGTTYSSNFPLQDAIDSTRSDAEGFIVKYAADGSEFVYSTYLGGDRKDYVYGIEIDSDGYCYATGFTNSSDYPTSVGSMDSLYGGGYADSFITILYPDGQAFNQSAYLGGLESEWGNAVTVGDDGRCYIVGASKGANFPITSELQTHQGEYDATLTVLTEDHSGINMSTFIGGTDNDYAGNIVLDEDGKIYITGTTYSTDFPLVNPYNATYGGNRDVHVVRINAELDTIELSTFIGGNSLESVADIGVDSSGTIYICGYSNSLDYPLIREIQDYGRAYLTTLAEDTIDPVITLISPETSQKVHGGMNVQVEVTDDWFIDTVWYNWDGGTNYTSADLSTIPCTYETTHTLRVYANDSAGNEASAIYNFLRGTTFFGFSTFLGGSDGDLATAVALDSLGNSYVVGKTYSTNFPMLNALNDTFGGVADIFLSKFSPSGELLFSTFIGGSDEDVPQDVTVDAAGNIYICGITKSQTDFPLVNPQNSTYGGGNWEGFLMKVDTTGASIAFSTYLGDTEEDILNGIKLDSSGNIIVVGHTFSNAFPTTEDALNDTKSAGADGVLVKYDSTGQSILYASFIGGDNYDSIRDIAIDTDGYCYLTGSTGSTDFPTQNALNSTINGGSDVFFMKIKPGDGLVYSTYFGSPLSEDGNSIAIDSAGNAFMVGDTSSSGYPLKNEIQSYQGGNDIIVTGINSTGTGVIFSTYLGSANHDSGEDIAIGPGGHVYIAGSVSGSGVTMSNALDASYSGGRDVLVARLNLAYNDISFATLLGGTAHDYGYGLDVHTDGSIVVVGQTASDTFPTDDAFNATSGGSFDTFVTWIGFDVTSPTVDSPPDENVQIGSSGNIVTWVPDDSNPDSYRVLMNGTEWDEGDWNTTDENITVDIDGLAEGVYNITIIVYDEGGNSDTDTILITVLDDSTDPTIDTPVDIEYDEFSNSNWITWNPTDDNPDSYVVYQDGTLFDSGEWDGSAIAVQVDDLSYGSYNFTIVVNDIGNNTATDTVWVTVVDGTWPVVDHPDDVWIDEGLTGNTLNWSTSDAHPISYSVYRNGTELESSAWSGGMVSVSLDGLSLGVYNFTIYLLDIDSNWRKDTVFVHVVDGTAPTLDSPPDISYLLGQTGHEIVWTPSDLHPLSYQVFRDGTPDQTGDWTGGAISISVDGLSAGFYNYTIEVTDIGGNTASDTVIVTVTSVTTVPSTISTNLPPPDGFDPLLVIIIVIISVTAVIIIVIIVNHKKKS